MSSLIDAMQWPAMLVTVVASWLAGSTHRGRRSAGFWLFIASNALWVACTVPRPRWSRCSCAWPR